MLLINYLNASPIYTGAPDPGGEFPAMFDVNRDGRVTPLDVLLVINYLNTAAMAVPGGEGESAPSPEAFVTAPYASQPSEPSPAAAVSSESPIWPAFVALDAARTTEATAVAQALDSDLLEAVLADLDDVLDDIAEQISRDWQ